MLILFVSADERFKSNKKARSLRQQVSTFEEAIEPFNKETLKF